jgi:cytochrome bd-type quinol oxidase subunit 2
MNAILFFIGGNVVALLYFSHLYLQLAEFKKKRKRQLYWMFLLRFSLLAAVLGAFFSLYPMMIPYIIAGLLSGRVAAQYLVHRKGFGAVK